MCKLWESTVKHPALMCAIDTCKAQRQTETYAVRMHVFEHARVRALHVCEITARRFSRTLHGGAARGGQRALPLRVRLLGVQQREVAQKLRAVALQLETVQGETPPRVELWGWKGPGQGRWWIRGEITKKTGLAPCG